MTLEEMYKRKLEMIMCMYSKSLFDLLIGITTTTKKQFLVDLKNLREIYDVREVDDILWIHFEKVSIKSRQLFGHRMFLLKLSRSFRRLTKKKILQCSDQLNDYGKGVR